jgi:maltose alpha-D-glucosyltransferase/alpha-amylase
VADAVYPTPDRDDGYDIVDFYGVDKRLGNLGDFVEVIRTAKDRGMRVIADLVVNHTSDQHPWFKARAAARTRRTATGTSGPDEPTPVKDGVVFPDQETSVWELDEKTGQYYLHQFYKHQPDLNVTNPKVRDEIAKIMGFWLQLGLSGFRVDAVPFFLSTSGADSSLLPDPHGYLRDLRSLLGRRTGDGILLGRGQPAARGPVALLRRRRRRRAHHAVRLHRHAEALPVARPRRRRAARRGAAGPAGGVPGLPVGDLRPQPRRAHLDKLSDDERQEVFDAFGPLPRCRCTAGAAAAAPADAGRRPAPDPDGVQPAVLVARHPRAVLRRGDRDGREPRR